MKNIIKTGFILLVVIIVIAGCQQQMDHSKKLKPLADKFLKVWNNGNYDALDTIVDPNFVRESNSQALVEGMDGLKEVMQGLRTGYPDLKISFAEEIYSDNKAAFKWNLTGTNTGASDTPATGKAVELWGMTIVHFNNGKITREIVAFDRQEWIEQLGFSISPPETD
jgi:steroid delta-isomerase-like uncharacterized protein